MPPKANHSARTPDTKTRRLTDFWAKKESGSSPQAPPSRTPASSSSPFKSAVGNHSVPDATPSPSRPHLTPGAINLEGFIQGRNKPDNLSSMKPGTSPHKFILIEDDDDDDEVQITKVVMKKRRREPSKESSARTMVEVLARVKALEKSRKDIVDLTRPPPVKKRATEALVLKKAESGNKTRLETRRMSHTSTPSEVSEISSLSRIDEDAGTSVGVQGEDLKDASEPPTAAPSIHTPGSSSVSPSANEMDKPTSPQLLQEPTAAEKARIRIEELKKKAVERSLEQQSFSLSASALILDASDEEDPLEKVLGPKKALSAKQAASMKPTKPTSRASSTCPASEAYCTSPLTDLASENETLAKGNIPPLRTTANAITSSSKVEEMPPKATKESKPSDSKSQSVSSFVTKPGMPSSLATLLSTSTKSGKVQDEKTVQLLREVEENMREITRRRIYGDSGDEKPMDSEPMMIDPSVTEMALGEEDGRKMAGVIASDGLTVAAASRWRPFWDEQLVGAHEIAIHSEYRLPLLPEFDKDHPILSAIRKTTARNDVAGLTVLLGAGMLWSIPLDLVLRMAPWCFNLACSPDAPTEVALLSELSITHMFSLIAKTNKRHFPLAYSHIISAIARLGPLTEAISTISQNDVIISTPHDPITRNRSVACLVRTLRAAMRSELSLPEPENIATLLLLLYSDPASSADMRRDISLAFEDFIANIASSSDGRARMKEMDICKRVVAVAMTFRLVEKRNILDCVFGGGSAPRRFMRWLAAGLLMPESVQILDWETYLQPPSLLPFAEMLDLVRNPQSQFRIWTKTNYENLYHNVEILGALLTDVRIYTSSQDAQLDRILSGLDTVHGRIADARAAFLDRTRVKDALQRLKLRVHFQYKHTGKATIEQMLKY